MPLIRWIVISLLLSLKPTLNRKQLYLIASQQRQPQRTSLRSHPRHPTAPAANRASTTVGVMLWTSVAASSVFPGLSAGTPSMGAMQSAIGALKLRIRCYYESNNNNNGGSSSGDSSGSSPGTVEGIVEIGGEIQDNPTQLTLPGLDNDDATTVFA
ncbi:Hypothetical protein, putative, partial [Bodo saltans]